MREVILDPRDATESPLDKRNLWNDEDFEEAEEELDEDEQEIERKVEEAAEKARHVARWEAKKEIEARERARKRFEEEEKAKLWIEQHPEYRLVRRDGMLCTELRPKEEARQSVGTAAIGCAGERQLAGTAELRSAGQPRAAVPTSAASSAQQVRENINGMIRKELPALTDAYNRAMQKEADRKAMKKSPQKESSREAEKKAT